MPWLQEASVVPATVVRVGSAGVLHPMTVGGDRRIERKRRRYMQVWLTLLFVLAGFSALAGSDAHVHGEADLELVQDGPRLHLRLEAPGESLLGIEHEPRNDAERAALRQLRETLADPGRWLLTTPKAGCLADPDMPANVQFSVADETHEHPVQDRHGHAEIVVEVGLVCAEPAALTGVEVALFAEFPGLRRIRAQLLIGDQQDYVELSSAANRITLKP